LFRRRRGFVEGVSHAERVQGLGVETILSARTRRATPALAHLGRLNEARSAAKAGLTLNPTYAVSRDRTVWTSVSDHPTFLAQLELCIEGMRKAGAPE
jgi:hypothetical protein